MQFEISRYVFDNLEIGTDIKQKMKLIESCKLSYSEFKRYDFAKNKFLQGRFDSNLSEERKNQEINKHIHEAIVAFDNILKANNDLSLFFQFMSNLASFKDEPTQEKVEILKENMQTLKNLNLSEEQAEFIKQIDSIGLDQIPLNLKRAKQ